MSEELLYWQALNRAMDAEMAADESVFTLGEDVGLYGGSYRVTEGLYAKYGEWRVRDTPISENSFTGLGVGRGAGGYAAGGRDHDHQFHAAGVGFHRQRAPPRSHSCRAVSSRCRSWCACPAASRASSGRNIPSGWSTLLMNVPGLRIAVPSTPQDAYWQLRQAIASDEPIILLEHELLYFSKGPVDVLADAPPMHRAWCDAKAGI